MANTQSQRLSIFIDMFLRYRFIFKENPKKLFFAKWRYNSKDKGFTLSYEGTVIYPPLEKDENNEFADTFIWAIEEKEQKSDEQEKPSATTLPARTFEEHLNIKQNASARN